MLECHDPQMAGFKDEGPPPWGDHKTDHQTKTLQLRLGLLDSMHVRNPLQLQFLSLS